LAQHYAINGLGWRSKGHPGRGCEKGLFRPGSFEQSSGQVTLPAHRPAQHDIATGQLVGRSCAGGAIAFSRALPNLVKVSFGERCGRLIGRLQEPGLKLRRDFEWLALLVAHAAEHVIRQLAGVGGDARTNLLPQELLNVLGQSNGHGKRIPLGGGGGKAKSRRLPAQGAYGDMSIMGTC
jgi:hypothetical protein